MVWLMFPEAPRWQLHWMVFRWFCLHATLDAKSKKSKDICTKATMYMAAMNTELEEKWNSIYEYID